MSTTQRCPHCGGSVPGRARFCQGCGNDVTRGKGPGAKLIALVVAGLIALAGLSYAGLQLTKPKAPNVGGNKQERPTQIAGAGQMPVWLLSSDRQVQDDYIWASTHLDHLQYIPCYCGCGSFGHTDNYSCYFKRDKNGAITGYDDHAVG